MRFPSVLLIGGYLISLSSCSSAAPAQAPVAPPRQCEIKQAVWCIDQEAYEIVNRLAEDGVHDRVWTLRGSFRPDSKLVVLEPNGCRTGRSDILSLVGYERDITWEGRTWERIKTRLKTDGSCDLEVLMPPFDGDPMEWAFSTGLILIKSCRDEECKSGSNLGDLKPRFQAEFRKVAQP